MEPKVFFEYIAEKYGLDARERRILDQHFGATGERLTFREIGERLGEIGELPLTRQRTHRIVQQIQATVDKAEWEKLAQFYPEPISETKYRKECAKARQAILEHLRSLTPESVIQYGQIHVDLGIPIPEERGLGSLGFDEIQSCMAFMEDYGAKNFGKYRYCTRCQAILPIGEFYKVKGRGRPYVYQMCRSCNSERCVESARENRRAERELAAV